MQFSLNLILIAHIIRSIFLAFKDVKVIGLIIIGVLSITLLSIMGLDAGRMAVAYLIISISVFLIAFFRKKLIKKNINLFGVILLTAFLFLFLISYFYSPASGSEYGVWKIRQFVSLAFIPAVLILLAGKLKSKEISLIEDFIIFSCVVTSSVVLYNTFSSGGFDLLQSNWFERQSIGGMNPIWLSRFLGLGLIVLQAPRFEKKPLLVFLLSVVLITTSLLTGSKTVLYFTIPIVILYKLFNSRLNKKLFFNLFAVLGIVTLIFLFLTSINSDALVNRFSLQSGTVGMREIMYQTSLNAYLSGNNFNLLFGHGGATIGESLDAGYIRWYPHNLLIEILYELGLMGLFVFLAQFLLVLFLFIKGRRNWVFFAYILHFLFSLTSGDLPSNDLVFTLFALYLVSEREEIQKTKQRNKKRIKVTL